MNCSLGIKPLTGDLVLSRTIFAVSRDECQWFIAAGPLDGRCPLPANSAPLILGRNRNVFAALIIGDEILSGKRQDKHFPKIVELLKSRGLGLSWSMNLTLASKKEVGIMDGKRTQPGKWVKSMQRWLTRLFVHDRIYCFTNLVRIIQHPLLGVNLKFKKSEEIFIAFLHVWGIQFKK